MTSNYEYLRLFQSSQKTVLNQYRSFQNIPCKLNRIQDHQTKIIKFSSDCQKDQFQKLQWRKKTGFPVVKILNYRKLNNQKPSSNQYLPKKVLVELTLQNIFYNLSEVDQIPVLKVYYLIKETLIGVERLCNLYGNFLLKSNMVSIDSKKRCKVWHHSKLCSNKPEFRCSSQEETVRSLVKVFYEKTKSSFKSNKMFWELQKCRTFCDCITVVKSYTFDTKIPHNFTLVDKFSSNMCSPRKYISRPPSSEYNPESTAKPITEFSVPALQRNQRQNNQKSKFTIFTQNRPRVNSFAGFMKKKPQYLTLRENQRKSPTKKISTAEFENYLVKLVQKIEEEESVSPKTIQKRQVSPIDAKTLCVIQSAYEGESSCCSIIDAPDHPSVRLLSPKVRQQSNENTIMYRSSVSLGRSFVEKELCLNLFGSGEVETNDEVIMEIKEAHLNKIFLPFMKFVDKSFDDGKQRN